MALAPPRKQLTLEDVMVTNASPTFSLMLHAAPKVGKTFCAATVSEHYPKDEDVGKKWVSLDDVIWNSFDDDATIGLRANKINVPYELDFNRILALVGNAPAAMMELKRLNKELLRAHPEIKYLISDTDSGLDVIAENYANNLQLSGWDKYREMRGIHFKNTTMAKDLRGEFHVSTIRLCHSKKESEETKTDIKLAARGTADSVIIPALTGNSGTLYMRDVSGHFAVKKLKTPTGWKRSLVTLTSSVFDAGSRFEQFLNDEEPANLRLLRNKVLVHLLEKKE